MNQAFPVAETPTSQPGDDWVTIFNGGGVMAPPPAGVGDVDKTSMTAAADCRSLTTISAADLSQLDSFPAEVAVAADTPAATSEVPPVPDSTTAAERMQRLSGLPLKHRYKQTAKSQQPAARSRRN